MQPVPTAPQCVLDSAWFMHCLQRLRWAWMPNVTHQCKGKCDGEGLPRLRLLLQPAGAVAAAHAQNSAVAVQGYPQHGPSSADLCLAAAAVRRPSGQAASLGCCTSAPPTLPSGCMGAQGVDSVSSCPTLEGARLFRAHACSGPACMEGCSTHPAWGPA